ncbi:MAG: phage integrase SAM-like domain-containing protein [Dysgonomonas sp.]
MLQIEVRQQGTSGRIFLSTGIKLFKNQFSDKMGFTCKSHNLADAITKQAKDIFEAIQDYAISDKCKNLKDVRNWNKSTSNKENVISFIESEMRMRNMQYNTLKAHVTLVNKLRDFGNMTVFEDVTYFNIVEFDKDMRSKDIKNVSINKMHSLLNMYLKIAINKELIQSNPYSKFSPPKAKNTDPVFLTQEEVHKIKKVKGLNEKLDKVKDLFLFQCFTNLVVKEQREETRGKRLAFRKICL